MKKTDIYLCAVVALVVLITPCLARAQMIEETDVIPEKQITALEQRAIRKAAVNVTKHIVDAREAIQKKDYAAAKKALNSSLRLINLIKETSAPVIVHDYVWVAKKHLAMDEAREVVPDLVPIYSSLMEFEDFYPESTVRSHIKKAEEHLKKDKKSEAMKELDLGEEYLMAIEADMPVEYTRSQISAALDALAKNDPAKAAESLKMAENGVQLTVTSVATPGLLAKTALWQATRAYDAKNYDKADAAVKQAKKYLQEAVSNMGVDEKYKALDIIREIDALEGKISKGGAETGKQLQAIWSKSRALEERIANVSIK